MIDTVLCMGRGCRIKPMTETNRARTPAPPAEPATPVEPSPARPATPAEIGGAPGPEPTRYGDWQHKGRVSDF